MQGSLEDWMEHGGPVDTTPISYGIRARDLVPDLKHREPPSYVVPSSAKQRFIEMDRVLLTIQIGDRKLIDTRGPTSFDAGHMPGAINIPYRSLVEPDNPLILKPISELRALLESKRVITSSKVSPRILLTCGSGVSVCHMALVLEELGLDPALIYDGSWNEWGSDPTTPKVIDTQ